MKLRPLKRNKDNYSPLENTFLLLVPERIERIAEEVQKIRDHCLCTLLFEQIDQMVVGCRRELDQNLAYDTDARFLLIRDRKIIKNNRVL